jgi:hypothetical protein
MFENWAAQSVEGIFAKAFEIRADVKSSNQGTLFRKGERQHL